MHLPLYWLVTFWLYSSKWERGNWLHIPVNRGVCRFVLTPPQGGHQERMWHKFTYRNIRRPQYNSTGSHIGPLLSRIKIKRVRVCLPFIIQVVYNSNVLLIACHVKMAGNCSQERLFWGFLIIIHETFQFLFCFFSLLTSSTWQVPKSQNCNNQQKYPFSSQSCHFTQKCFLLSWNNLSVKKLHKINGIIFF